MSVLKNVASSSCSIITPIVKCPAGVSLSFVRFRKMRWLEKAPTKMYRVREPTPIDPVEYDNMKVWTQHYNTEIKSLRSYIVHHTSEVTEERKRKLKMVTLSFDERLAEITQKNNTWNIKTKSLRDTEMSEIAGIDAERATRIAERDIREREEMQEAARSRVMQEKVNLESGEFILEEQLDEELDKLLNTRADYNYAINLDGSKANTSNSESSETVKESGR